jgi:pimeloyl-ACP methyl ester carboxylesterase
LATPRHQEVYTFLKGRPHPDRDGVQFYRDEPVQIYESLKNIRCPVFYLFGGKSNVSPPESIARKMKNTGKGDAEMCILEEAGHLVPQEEVDKSGN